jgi:P27 family predicted phage terminase small subunit
VCPSWLDELAAEHWTTYAPPLVRLGLLTVTSEPAFAALCETWSLYRRSADRVQKRTTRRSRANGTIPRPEVGIRKGALDTYHRLCVEFGMTPAALVRLGTTPETGQRGKWAGLAN